MRPNSDSVLTICRAEIAQPGVPCRCRCGPASNAAPNFPIAPRRRHRARSARMRGNTSTGRGKPGSPAEQMAQRCRLIWRDDLGVPGIGVEPSFAIGQRALLLREADGCVMWDCVPLATPQAVDYVRSLGGLKAIAISHPHYYGAVVDWSEAFGGVPGLSAWRRSCLGNAAASVDRAVDRRELSALGRHPDPAHGRPFCRRHGAALARGGGGAGRACSPATSRWWRWIGAR